MKSKELFSKSMKIITDLELAIDQIQLQNDDVISQSETILMEIDFAVRNLKNLVVHYRFDSVADEVHFFKYLKPRLVSKFIFYCSVLHLEVEKPLGTSKTLKKYYESLQEKLQDYQEQHPEIHKYYRSRATQFDEKFFIRYRFDFKMDFAHNLHSFDEDFTTSHDHFFSEIMANDLLNDYLLLAVSALKIPMAEAKNDDLGISYTGTKTSALEVLYSQYLAGFFNNGNTDFSEVVRHYEKSYNIDLGHYHKTINEIKNRKSAPTKYLDILSQRLLQHFQDGEE